ncbi:ABC transporter substrate-binding protein [Bifidobacterium catenulatum]|uniref:ABC transporter substrate-binding protein n=1 Tax=Bifidobacterium catenulatum TaxID=1686 RepID=UPI003D3279C7
MRVMKSKMLHVVVAGAAAVAMMAPLAACGSSSTGGEKTKISFYSYFKENQIGDVVKGFEKANPNIILDVQYGQDPSQYISTLQTRLAGGKPPTIFNITMDNRTDVMNSGAVANLTGKDFLKGVDDSNFQLFQQDGKIYGLPVSAWVGVMFYNKDLLNQAGYDEFPKTWDEFIEMGKKINASGGTAFLEDFNSQPSGTLAGLVASNWAKRGVDVPDQDIWDGKTTFTDAWGPAVEAWGKAVKEGVIPTKSVGLSADQIKQEFVNGSLAVMRSGPWDLEDVKASGVNFGVAAMPAIDGGEQWINGGPDQGFAIAEKATDNEKAAAEKFLSYLNSEEGLKAFTSAAGTMSLSDNYQAEPPAELKDVVDTYFAANKFYWYNWSKSPAAMTTVMTDQQQKLVQGKISASDMTKALDSKWSSLK